VAVLVARQPARRIRIIELTLFGLVALPLVPLLPGYPHVSLLPALDAPRSGVVQNPAPPVAAPEVEVFQDQPTTTEAIAQLQPPAADVPAVEVTLPAPLTPEPAIEPVPDEPLSELSSAPHEGPLTIVVESAVVASDEPGVTAAMPPEAIETNRVGSRWQRQWLGDYRFCVVVAYFAGVAGMAGWSMLGAIALVRLLRSCQPASEECRKLLREIAGPASDRVALVVSERIGQPYAVAWRPPTIVLPVDWCSAGKSQQLRWALAHEWSHVARGDAWTWSASGLVRWFYFYQPLAWWLRHQLRLSQDFLADQRAAQAGAAAEDYAEFLASCSTTRPALAAALGIGGRTSDLHRRIVMLVENRHPLESAAPRRWNLVVLLFAVLLVAAVASLREQPVAAEAEPKQDTKPIYTIELSPPPETKPGPKGESAAIDTEQPAGPVETKAPALHGKRSVIVEDASSNEAPVETKAPALHGKLGGGRLGGGIPSTVRLGGGAPPNANSPRRIAPGDILTIDVITNYAEKDGPLAILLRSGTSITVDADGTISLGSTYGTVDVGGKTTHTAEEAIQGKLNTYIEESIARVSLEDKEVAKALTVKNPQINVRVTIIAKMFMGGIGGGMVFPAQAPATYEPSTEPGPKGEVDKNSDGFTRRQPAAPKIGSSPAIAERPQAGRIKRGDVLLIEAEDAYIISGQPAGLNIPRRVMVESDGNIALGVQYGRVNVLGKTLIEAEEAIRPKYAESIKDPQVQVTYADLPAATSMASMMENLGASHARVAELEREVAELKTMINKLKSGRTSR
jgi:protein involved in polysaccharide export with SLBB domain/beta-lactamase regulating signal transducer with metallopeptidase domain